MKRWKTPLAAAGGALVAFLFDPVSGRRRRAQLGQRVPAFFGRRGRQLSRVAGHVSSDAYGAKQRLVHGQREEKEGALNDPALARKVETEIFRDPDVPKGRIDVNAENGVVILRGEVENDTLIRDLEAKTRSVQGVRDVENLLHTPGTEAPMHQVH
jgi:osmotically-inducible protein OsmY